MQHGTLATAMEGVIGTGGVRRAPDDALTLDTVFASIDDGFCLCEIIVDQEGRPADYRFLRTNQHFERMTGLADAEGHTALELVPELERHWIETYGSVALKRETRRFQEGSEALGRWFDVFAAPVEPHGRFVIVFRDVTDQRAAEVTCHDALQRAEHLLSELNHRVVNSLGMIASIISLEARGREVGEGRRALERIGGRVMAVAELYRTLDSGMTVGSVSAPDYLGDIVTGLLESVGNGAELRAESDIAPIELSTWIAAPLGLIVNELVTNSLKHAFACPSDGVVHVRLRVEGDDLLLSVADNGLGIADSPPPESGIGRKLVSTFVSQLNGEMETESGAEGTTVSIRIPDWQSRPAAENGGS